MNCKRMEEHIFTLFIYKGCTNSFKAHTMCNIQTLQHYFSFFVNEYGGKLEKTYFLSCKNNIVK